MTLWNLIGRWWGLAVAIAAISLAGVVSAFLPLPLGSIVAMPIGILGGITMLAIGARYE